MGHPRSSMNAPAAPKQAYRLVCTVSPITRPTYTAACAARLRCHHFLQAASNIRERESAHEALFPFSTPTTGESESHQGEALGKLSPKFSFILISTLYNQLLLIYVSRTHAKISSYTLPSGLISLPLRPTHHLPTAEARLNYPRMRGINQGIHVISCTADHPPRTNHPLLNAQSPANIRY